MTIREDINSLVSLQNLHWDGNTAEAQVLHEQLETVLLYAFEHLKFYWLKDICVTEKNEDNVLNIRYILQNPQESIVLIISSPFNDNTQVKSVASIWLNAPILESEVFEMFGVHFNYRPKRRWFSEAFKHYPLRHHLPPVERPQFSEEQKNMKSQLRVELEFPMDSFDTCFYVTLDHDNIKSCLVETGYHHIGIEKSLEGMNFSQVQNKIALLNYDAGIFWSMAWAMMIEDGNQINIPDKAKGIRMILAELIRIRHHLQILAKIAYKTQYQSFFNTLVYWHSRTLDQLRSITNRKNLSDIIVVGGLWNDLPAGWMASCSDFLSLLEKHLVDEYKFFYKNSFWHDRLQCGRVSREEAMKASLGGPVLRATGVNHDQRKRMPYYFYNEVSFDIPLGVHGNIYDRFLVYTEEIFQSIRILIQVLDNIPAGKTISDQVLNFMNYKTSQGVEDTTLYKRCVELETSVQFDKKFITIEGENGLLNIWAEFAKDGLTQRVKCSSNAAKLLSLYEKNIVGEKLEDLDLFWVSMGIDMREVER